MNELYESLTKWPNETTAESRLKQAQAAQRILADLCFQAAVERWPAFDDLAAKYAKQERDALREMGPTA